MKDAGVRGLWEQRVDADVFLCIILKLFLFLISVSFTEEDINMKHQQNRGKEVLIGIIHTLRGIRIQQDLIRINCFKM